MTELDEVLADIGALKFNNQELVQNALPWQAAKSIGSSWCPTATCLKP